MVLVEGVEGGGGGGGEESAECERVWESAGLLSVVSALPSALLRVRLQSLCAREGGSRGVSLPLSLSFSPSPPSLCLCVCVCAVAGGGDRRERRGRRCGAGGGGGPRRRGEQDAGRGHLPMIGCKLHGEQEAHAGQRSFSQIPSSPARPRFPARPPALGAAEDLLFFFPLWQIIVWKGWKRGRSRPSRPRSLRVCLCTLGGGVCT